MVGSGSGAASGGSGATAAAGSGAAVAATSTQRPCTGHGGSLWESDRKLYPEVERLMRDEHKSATAAARQLAEAGQVVGAGTEESRARRLAKRYLDDLERHVG